MVKYTGLGATGVRSTRMVVGEIKMIADRILANARLLENVMQKSIVGTMCFAALGVTLGYGMTAAAAPLPLLEFKFDNGSLANTGSLGGTASLITAGGMTPIIGEGLGGADQGLDNTSAAGMGAITGNPQSGYMTYAANSAFLGLTSWTISGFYKVPAGSGLTEFDWGASARLLSFDTNGTFLFMNQGHLYLNDNNSASTGTDVTKAYGPLDTWVYFAVTYDGTDLHFYAANENDPTVKAFGSVSRTFTESTAKAVYIANFSGAIRPFDGLMDDIRLYGAHEGDAVSAALSIAELQAEATQGFAQVPEPGAGSLIMLGGLSLLMRRRYPTGR